MQAPTIIRKRSSAPADTKSQVAQIRAGSGEWSHDEELPLRVRIKRTGWLCRKISVTTTELVWYRDAITYIEVPAGFTYDLASIPRVLWAIVSPLDLALESLFHDLLYRQQRVKRITADRTLQSMMEDRQVPGAIRWTVYLGVRLGGWVAWNQRRRENIATQAAAAITADVTNRPVQTPSAVAPDKIERTTS